MKPQAVITETMPVERKRAPLLWTHVSQICESVQSLLRCIIADKIKPCTTQVQIFFQSQLVTMYKYL